MIITTETNVLRLTKLTFPSKLGRQAGRYITYVYVFTSDSSFVRNIVTTIIYSPRSIIIIIRTCYVTLKQGVTQRKRRDNPSSVRESFRKIPFADIVLADRTIPWPVPPLQFRFRRRKIRLQSLVCVNMDEIREWISFTKNVFVDEKSIVEFSKGV